MLYDDSVEDAAVGPLGNSTGSWFAAAEGCSVVGRNDAMNGNQSLRLGSGCVAVNRGVVAAGPETTSMHFVGGKEYEGYLFAKAAAKATLRVSLLCTAVGSIGGPSRFKIKSPSRQFPPILTPNSWAAGSRWARRSSRSAAPRAGRCSTSR